MASCADFITGNFNEEKAAQIINREMVVRSVYVVIFRAYDDADVDSVWLAESAAQERIRAAGKGCYTVERHEINTLPSPDNAG